MVTCAVVGVQVGDTSRIGVALEGLCAAAGIGVKDEAADCVASDSGRRIDARERSAGWMGSVLALEEADCGIPGSLCCPRPRNSQNGRQGVGGNRSRSAQVVFEPSSVVERGIRCPASLGRPAPESPPPAGGQVVRTLTG